MLRGLFDRVERAGLGLRIFLAFVLVVGLMVGVGASVFVSLLGGYREAIDRQELHSVADTIAIDIARGVKQAQPAEEIAELIRRHAESTHTIVFLLDSSGGILEGFEPYSVMRGHSLPITWKMVAANESTDGWFRTDVDLDGERQPVISRVLATFATREGKRDAILLAVGFADDRPNAAVADLAPRLLMSGLAGLVAAALLALVLSRSLVRPLRDLTGVVAEFGRGRQEVRAEAVGPAQVRELAAAFNSMAQRVSANERAMRGFIADVSHELRTPLTSIRGFTQALLDGTVTAPDSQRHSLEVIQQEARRMLRMVEQMLDLSRLEAGEQPLELSDVSPSELVDHVHELFGPRAEERGVELRRSVAPTAPLVRADHDRLVQVLSNLVENAVRHTEAGWIELRAYGESGLSAAGDAGSLVLEVEDTGEGIAAERLPHLFDRFYQSPDRSGPGAGLGLAISQEIVRAHGGEIGATSVEGEGTTIRIRLPSSAAGDDVNRA